MQRQDGRPDAEVWLSSLLIWSWTRYLVCTNRQIPGRAMLPRMRRDQRLRGRRCCLANVVSVGRRLLPTMQVHCRLGIYVSRRFKVFILSSGARQGFQDASTLTSTVVRRLLKSH